MEKSSSESEFSCGGEKQERRYKKIPASERLALIR